MGRQLSPPRRATHVVNKVEADRSRDARQGVRIDDRLISRKEWPGIGAALHKGVQRVTVRLHCCNDDRPVRVRQLGRLLHDGGTTGYCAGKDLSRVGDAKGDVLYSVSVHSEVSRDVVAEQRCAPGVEGGAKGEKDAALADDVGDNLAAARFEATVCHSFKAEPDAEPRGGLLGVADPPVDVIEARKGAILGLGALI